MQLKPLITKDERTSTLSIYGTGSGPFLAKSGPGYGPILAEIGSGFGQSAREILYRLKSQGKPVHDDRLFSQMALENSFQYVLNIKGQNNGGSRVTTLD